MDDRAEPLTGGALAARPGDLLRKVFSGENGLAHALGLFAFGVGGAQRPVQRSAVFGCIDLLAVEERCERALQVEVLCQREQGGCRVGVEIMA